MKEFDKPISIIEQADMKIKAVQEAQAEAEIKNAAIRHMKRMAFYKHWSSPEEIKKRQEEHEARAGAALARAKLMSDSAREALGIPEDPPLPDEKDLPAHMRGQSPSTIRAMLRHERGYSLEKPKIELAAEDVVRILNAVPKKTLWESPKWYQTFWNWLKSFR